MLITSDVIQTVLMLMEKGATPTEVAATLGVSKKTFAKNVKLNDSLREAYELGLTKFEAKLENIGKDLMLGKLQGKESVWKAFMQRYGEGWADKAEVKDTTTVSELTDEELADRIKQLNILPKN